MQIKPITSPGFKKYGRIIELELSETLEKLRKTEDSEEVVYVASSKELEETSEFEKIQNSLFGGIKIQIGYCNGKNNALNALEYHRDSEINITATKAIFMVGSLQDVDENFQYDTSKVEIFEADANVAVEFYGTTLHFAPCSVNGEQFKVAVVLPKGTNTEKPELNGDFKENKLLTHKNKWLIAHKDANIEGAFVGLVGENIKI